MWDHTVGILIGGQSRRMGTPKHQVKLSDGRTMLDAVLSFAKDTAQKVVIIGGSVEGYSSVLDQRDQQGPVAGIEALLDSGLDDRYLVVGCDMPRITCEDVAPLLCDTDAAVFSHDGSTLGLPVMVSSPLLSACTAYLNTGRRSIRGFLAEVPHSLIPVDDCFALKLQSVNTPSDLDNLTFE